LRKLVVHVPRRLHDARAREASDNTDDIKSKKANGASEKSIQDRIITAFILLPDTLSFTHGYPRDAAPASSTTVRSAASSANTGKSGCRAPQDSVHLLLCDVRSVADQRCGIYDLRRNGRRHDVR